jgi:hypothetical protein
VDFFEGVLAIVKGSFWMLAKSKATDTPSLSERSIVENPAEYNRASLKEQSAANRLYCGAIVARPARVAQAWPCIDDPVQLAS